MKNLVYLGVALLGLSALTFCRDGHTGPTVMAAQAPIIAPGAVAAPTTTTAAPPAAPTPATSSVKGDLVLDFLGAVRGYVEPCG